MNFTFLFCSERSGSNLITRIMDSHSEICGPAPAHIFRIILNHRNRYGNLADPDNYSILVADIVALMRTSLGIWKTSWTEDELVKATENFSLAEMLRVIYEREARAYGKNALFIKENRNYRFIKFLKDGFPDARFVVFVRDPRDMALSWKRSPNLRGCVIRAAKTWHEDQLGVMRLLGTTDRPSDLYLIRYEDLLTSPKSTLQRLCDFLNIFFEPKMLEFFKTSNSNANAQQSQDWGNLQKPLMKKNFNKYRQALSTAEIQYVEAICGEQMQELGYKREYSELPEVGELRTLIEPEELAEKPAYADTPKTEQKMRARRFVVVHRIKQRPVIPRIS